VTDAPSAEPTSADPPSADPPSADPSNSDVATDEVEGASANAAPIDPADLPPEAFTERAAAARARGLPGPYIVGGDDPHLADELERERPYVRLLIGMIVAIVLGGFILGIVGMLIIEAGLA
jgi:hypothetical protein